MYLPNLSRLKKIINLDKYVLNLYSFSKISTIINAPFLSLLIILHYNFSLEYFSLKIINARNIIK